MDQGKGWEKVIGADGSASGPEVPSAAPCIAVFGTASDVGKSVIATALCRILSDSGLAVAPFKAQNMSNNSFVTLSEGEIARAQFVQAEASRVEATVDMNPVLLKPASDLTAQVVVHGQAIGNRDAADYFSNTDLLFDVAKQSLSRLRERFDAIVIEGAGSCAEVNLRERDFVNFKIAHACDAPVILVADIDRGGVFAQVIGTLAVLPEEDRKRVKGVLINRFRGDARLFEDGIRYLESQTGLPVLGLIPYFKDIEIDSEDALPLGAMIDPPGDIDPKLIQVAVILLPHLSNFTDFAPLARSGVQLHYLRSPRDLSKYQAVIIPGTKNTRSDLGWLRAQGWDAEIKRYVDGGGYLAGICGGYQILGKWVDDPIGIEGVAGRSEGLSHLSVVTTLAVRKTLKRREGRVVGSGEPVTGYEIHHGVTERSPELMPMLKLGDADAPFDDGAISPNGRVWGCYLHGIFDSPSFRDAFLRQVGEGRAFADGAQESRGSVSFRQGQYDRLAAHFRSFVDIPKLMEIFEGSATQSP